MEDRVLRAGTLFLTEYAEAIAFCTKDLPARGPVDDLITYHGGRPTDEMGPHTVYLVQDPEEQPSTDTQPPYNTFSVRYIKDCVDKKKLQKLKHYWVHKLVNFNENFDPVEVMIGNLTWEDCTKEMPSSTSGLQPVTVSDDEIFYNADSSTDKPRSQGRHKGRYPYTSSERLKILQYITYNKLHDKVNGNGMWKTMEADEVCPGRTWQSMREHFRRHILRQLHQYPSRFTDGFMRPPQPPASSFPALELLQSSSASDRSRDVETEQGRTEDARQGASRKGKVSTQQENESESVKERRQSVLPPVGTGEQVETENRLCPASTPGPGMDKGEGDKQERQKSREHTENTSVPTFHTDTEDMEVESLLSEKRKSEEHSKSRVNTGEEVTGKCEAEEREVDRDSPSILASNDTMLMDMQYALQERQELSGQHVPLSGIQKKGKSEENSQGKCFRQQEPDSSIEILEGPEEWPRGSTGAETQLHKSLDSSTDVEDSSTTLSTQAEVPLITQHSQLSNDVREDETHSCTASSGSSSSSGVLICDTNVSQSCRSERSSTRQTLVTEKDKKMEKEKKEGKIFGKEIESSQPLTSSVEPVRGSTNERASGISPCNSNTSQHQSAGRPASRTLVHEEDKNESSGSEDGHEEKEEGSASGEEKDLQRAAQPSSSARKKQEQDKEQENGDQELGNEESQEEQVFEETGEIQEAELLEMEMAEEERGVVVEGEDGRELDDGAEVDDEGESDSEEKVNRESKDGKKEKKIDKLSVSNISDSSKNSSRSLTADYVSGGDDNAIHEEFKKAIHLLSTLERKRQSKETETKDTDQELENEDREEQQWEDIQEKEMEEVEVYEVETAGEEEVLAEEETVVEKSYVEEEDDDDDDDDEDEDEDEEEEEIEKGRKKSEERKAKKEADKVSGIKIPECAKRSARSVMQGRVRRASRSKAAHKGLFKAAHPSPTPRKRRQRQASKQDDQDLDNEDDGEEEMTESESDESEVEAVKEKDTVAVMDEEEEEEEEEKDEDEEEEDKEEESEEEEEEEEESEEEEEEEEENNFNPRRRNRRESKAPLLRSSASQAVKKKRAGGRPHAADDGPSTSRAGSRRRTREDPVPSDLRAPPASRTYGSRSRPSFKQSKVPGAYTVTEDVAIINHIVNEDAYQRVGGRALWEEMAATFITARTWQSLKERFRKRIVTNLRAYTAHGLKERTILKLEEHPTATTGSGRVKNKKQRQRPPSQSSTHCRQGRAAGVSSSESEEESALHARQRKSHSNFKHDRRLEGGSFSESEEEGTGYPQQRISRTEARKGRKENLANRKSSHIRVKKHRSTSHQTVPEDSDSRESYIGVEAYMEEGRHQHQGHSKMEQSKDDKRKKKVTPATSAGATDKRGQSAGARTSKSDEFKKWKLKVLQEALGRTPPPACSKSLRSDTGSTKSKDQPVRKKRRLLNPQELVMSPPKTPISHSSEDSSRNLTYPKRKHTRVGSAGNSQPQGQQKLPTVAESSDSSDDSDNEAVECEEREAWPTTSKDNQEPESDSGESDQGSLPDLSINMVASPHHSTADSTEDDDASLHSMCLFDL